MEFQIRKFGQSRLNPYATNCARWFAPGFSPARRAGNHACLPLAAISGIAALLLPMSVNAAEITWPPSGALHSDPDLVRQGSEVGLRAVCNGIPLYGYGYTYIYGRSPDFYPGSRIQESNSVPLRKLIPKKSWQLVENRIGATPPRMPRTARADIQPLLDIHLIDGDPKTYWGSRGANGPDVEPAWVRIDLPREMALRSVVLVPRADATGMPGDLTIRLSREWDPLESTCRHASLSIL